MEKRPVILAVDDEPSVLRVLERALVPAGLDLVTTNDGHMALELMEQKPPDLVLLDIMMPGLDGFQILGHIRQRLNIPVIMLTAKCDVTTMRDCFHIGADDFMHKPFSVIELIARVKAKLRRAGANPTQMELLAAQTPKPSMQPQSAQI